ncbi:hypothetical protein GCM10028806_34740 [Spirosoma terrae]|uniref:Uncharacterized protein n=1 Tax=Spirosoma terrae TaxID=1968276 RepID=A0A6L9LBE6_9BACT|nr:hypothetical protein [Spirosoma terrae]NDU95788.1 hypothetical protein [Spirosoma terrae]
MKIFPGQKVIQSHPDFPETVVAWANKFIYNLHVCAQGDGFGPIVARSYLASMDKFPDSVLLKEAQKGMVTNPEAYVDLVAKSVHDK